MASGLRLVALANGRYRSVRTGCDDACDESAAQLVHLALKARRSALDEALNPIRLLPTHLHGPATTPPETDRLEQLAERVGGMAVDTLFRSRSPATARDLCRLFRLGQDGMRAWERQRKKTKKSGAQKKKGKAKGFQPPRRARPAEPRAGPCVSRFAAEATEPAELDLESEWAGLCDGGLADGCPANGPAPPAALPTPQLHCAPLQSTLLVAPMEAVPRQGKAAGAAAAPPARGLAAAFLPLPSQTPATNVY